MKNRLAAGLLFLLVGRCQAQVLLKIEPVFGTKPLVVTDAPSPRTDSLQVTTLRFYLSKIEFFKNGERVFSEENSFHLIDATVEKSCSIALKTPAALAFDELKFSLGLDSLTNVSGALGGDLDPAKGMFWTWQSGYINFKIEGRSAVCSTRRHEFQFHLGGYAGPFLSLKNVILKTTGSPTTVKIGFDAAAFLKEIDLKTQNSVMIPGQEAVLLAEKAARAFKILE